MGFVIVGRQSIFWIAGLTFIQSFGLIIIFFNVFGEIMKAFMTTIFWSDIPDDEANFGMKRACYVMILGALLLPFVIRKELAELKIISFALFCSALIFVALNIGQIAFRGNSLSNHDSDRSEYIEVNFNADFIQGIVIIFTACNFQTNLFPI